MTTKQSAKTKTVSLGDWRPSKLTESYVKRILTSGRIGYGPFSRELEKRFAALHDCRYGVLSNSGTSALQVALQTLKELHGWADGDSVIVPAVTFVATVNIVLHNRMTPILADVDPQYYSINPELIEQVITPRTRAIIPVHPFGQPADMAPIREIADRYNLAVIEDSCESAFVSQNGQKVGSMSDIGCFSLYMAHLLTAGVGGLSLTSNPDYAAKMRSLVNHGRDGIYISIDDDDRVTPEILARRFRFESVGHSFRVTEFEAALALAQLGGWADMISRRYANAAHLTDGLYFLGMEKYLQLPRVRPTNGHAWMMYPLVVREGNKWPLIEHLERAGIETREMLPLTNQPVYDGWCNEADYPVAKWINDGGFYVGCHQYLSEADLDHIIETIGGFFNGR